MSYLGASLPLGSLIKPAKTPAKPKRAIKRLGKVDAQWRVVRQEWLDAHPVDYRDSYPCGLCGQPVHKDELDLDHSLRRGSHPGSRFDLTLLVPVHRSCHIKKDGGMRNV